MPIDINTSPDKNDNNDSYSTKQSGENPDFGTARALAVGSEFDDIEVIFQLYGEYGRLMGFGVKKGSQSYFKGSAEIRMKVFLCVHEGRHAENRYATKDAAYRKQHMRTECKACLRACRDSMEVPWRVTVFITHHNHELLPQPQGYLLRSARNLTAGKGSLVAALHAAGIGVSQAHRFMSNEAGGVQNIGFLKKDAYHYLDKLHKEQRQPDGDANALVKFLFDRANKENDFYSNVDTDDDGRIVNFFFRDSRCKIDYLYFGDVIFVDATYKTNKYDLYCVPFTGINHHGMNVMFGITFLSNENTESFEWLFSRFLESMDGKEPQVIFTDQCQAMMNGVDYTFHEASHRLCHWHINRNTKSHFGTKLSRNPEFMKQWHRCMKGCETEDEFEMRWRAMIEDNRPSTDRDWFKTMYKLKKRWASVFTHNKFSGGYNSTGRSESTNRALKELCSANSPLYDLVLKYELLIRGWRESEAADDAANRGIPGGVSPHQRLLMNVAQIYTRTIFKRFEEEAVHSFDCDITKQPADLQDAVLEYKMTNHGGSTRIRTVRFNRYTHHATCSCHMFETVGVICRHILKIYTYSMVYRVPQQLILSRWTKEAKTRISHDHLSFDVSAGRPDFVRILGFGNRSMRRFFDLLDKSRNRGCEEIIDACLEDMEAKVQAKSKVSDPESQSQSNKSKTRDPAGRKPKGGSKHFRSNLDTPKAKRGPKRTCMQTPSTKTRSVSPSLSLSLSLSLGGSQAQFDDVASSGAVNSSTFESSKFRFD